MQMYVTGSFPLTYSELRQISVLKKNEQFHLKLGKCIFFLGASENLMLMSVEGFISQLKSTMERRNQK